MKMILLILLCVFSAHGYPAHNFVILENECVEKSQQDFQKNKMKETKITVNERLMGYYGFESSASAIILLDVSNTDVQLPKMNLSFTNLIMLHASNNGLRKIDDIGNETFPSLKFLNLSSNAISTISSHVFSHLSEVEVLDLSHNCFVHFNYDHVFIRHEHLKKIFLHDNILHSVHGTPGINHVLHLDMLDVSKNFIEKFDTLNLQVKNLKLRANNLKTLTIHQSKAMALDASENSLTSFTGIGGTFSRLDLSKNDFTSMTQIEIREAKYLTLSRNKITSIHASSEEEDAEIIETLVLDLSYNNISSMNDLKQFKNCEVINLEANQMHNLDFEKIRQDFPHVKRVNLIRNPLSEIDITEAKFHNDTRFLNIQFDYALESVQESTLLPSLEMLFPTLPTIEIKTTTLAQISTTTIENFTQSVEEEIEIWAFLVFLYWPILSLLIASILVVVYVICGSRSSVFFRLMNHNKYNEAANPL